MKFTPKTREEALTIKLLEKGNYAFKVLASKEKISQSGNPMIEILIKVWDETGKEHLLYDYLMESFEAKLRHFCYSINLGEMSEKGEFDCELIKSKNGVCRIYIKEDKTGLYPSKNAVADYIVPMDNGAPTNLKGEPFKDDEELPF